MHDMNCLMRPVVRWAVVHGVGHAVVSRWIKRLFLQEAQASLRSQGRSISDSALALAAGLHRADIHKLQSQIADEIVYEVTIPVTRQILAAWALAGLPATIPFKSGSLSDPADDPKTFTDLVQRTPKAASQSFSASLILQDMQRQGLVKDSAGQVTLTHFSVDQPQGRRQAMAYLSQAGHDFMSAGLHNLQVPESAQFLEQSLEVDGLFPDSVDELHKQATQLWAQMLQTLLSQATALSEQDEPLGGKQRMRLGIYFYTKEPPTEADAVSPSPGRNTD